MRESVGGVRRGESSPERVAESRSVKAFRRMRLRSPSLRIELRIEDRDRGIAESVADLAELTPVDRGAVLAGFAEDDRSPDKTEGRPVVEGDRVLDRFAGVRFGLIHWSVSYLA